MNSRSANDDKKLKSRFHIPNDYLKQNKGQFNRRYRVLYIKEDAKKSPEYLKRKERAKILISSLKVIYSEETEEIQSQISALSKALRTKYPELNEEIPINS